MAHNHTNNNVLSVPIVMAISAILIFLATTTAAQTTSCAEKLVPCVDYMNSTSPPDSCCTPLKEAVENELVCLCNLFNTPGLITGFGINITDALILPSRCKINGDLSACSNGFIVFIGTSPITYTCNSPHKQQQQASSGPGLISNSHKQASSGPGLINNSHKQQQQASSGPGLINNSHKQQQQQASSGPGLISNSHKQQQQASSGPGNQQHIVHGKIHDQIQSTSPSSSPPPGIPGNDGVRSSKSAWTALCAIPLSFFVSTLIY